MALDYITTAKENGANIYYSEEENKFWILDEPTNVLCNAKFDSEADAAVSYCIIHALHPTE